MEFVWNKCSAYLKQTEPKSAKRPGAIKLSMVQTGSLQVLCIRTSFSIKKMQENNRKVDEEKQFVKIYLASVSTRIGLNFSCGVSFCSLIKRSLPKWKFYHEFPFSQICLGGAGADRGWRGLKTAPKTFWFY